MSNQTDTSNDKPQIVQDIIHEIEEKSKGGGYIYRGERKRYNEPPYYGKVSSNLWREYGIEEGHFNIELVQKELLAAAKKHTGDLPQDFHLDVIATPNTVEEPTQEAIDFEILTEIQHYGGKTNLIDFTTDYFIALFFACDGRYDEDGRIILQKTDEIRDMIAHPRNPRHRVIVQKSVFVRPPRGFIEPREEQIVIIPKCFKQQLLKHLRDYHGISTEVIYNDLQGFIRNQDIHGDAYTHFYRGFACRNRADEAPTPKEKQQECEKAITHYDKAIKLKPDDARAYNNRGNAHADKGELDKAIKDHTTALQLQPHLAKVYTNRGTAYADRGEIDSAITDYNTAIQLQPNDAEAYYNRGIAYKEKGEVENAIESYTKAIELKSDLVQAYYNRGNAYREKGEVENAIKDHNTAIQFHPDDAEAYHNRGITYLHKGEFNLAIKDYTQAIQLNPNYADAYYNRGIAQFGLRAWENAKSDLTTAKNLGSDIATVFRNGSGSVENFERISGIRLPADIAEMLTPKK